LAIAAKNGISTNDCELYITTAPCAQCAKLIIASGIKKVYYKEIYKNNFGLELLNECNIMCEQVVF
jgi:dCMP deaminase